MLDEDIKKTYKAYIQYRLDHKPIAFVRLYSKNTPTKNYRYLEKITLYCKNLNLSPLQYFRYLHKLFFNNDNSKVLYLPLAASISAYQKLKEFLNTLENYIKNYDELFYLQYRYLLLLLKAANFEIDVFELLQNPHLPFSAWFRLLCFKNPPISLIQQYKTQAEAYLADFRFVEYLKKNQLYHHFLSLIGTEPTKTSDNDEIDFIRTF